MKLEKRSNGIWYARMLKDGRWIRRSLKTTSKREAQRAAALRRYAHLCATHVPDIITVDEPYTLSETKCYNSLKPSGAGRKSRKSGT